MGDSMAENDRTVEFLPLSSTGPTPEDDDMFSIHCPVHGGSGDGSRVLLSERRIRAIEPVEAGLRVRYECWCGHPGAYVTGRRSMVGRHRPTM